MPNPLVIIKWGESNSAGRALNTSATAQELLPQPRLRYLNNTSLTFENLTIGTNNILGHDRANAANGVDEPTSWAKTRHGWELTLARRITENTFGLRPIYMLHTGQGGSLAAEWGAGSSYMETYNTRVTALKNALPAFDCVIWGTIGINDSINRAGQESSYITAMAGNLTRLRAPFNQKVPIFLTGLTNAHSSYTQAVKAVCDNNPNTYFVPSLNASENPADGGDSNHWGYQGVQLIANRLIRQTLAVTQPQL